MVTRQNISVTINKGEHEFTFHMPVGTSWGNAVDAAWEIANHVGDLARQSKNSVKPATEEISSDESVPTEPEVIEPTLVEGV